MKNSDDSSTIRAKAIFQRPVWPFIRKYRFTTRSTVLLIKALVIGIVWSWDRYWENMKFFINRWWKAGKFPLILPSFGRLTVQQMMFLSFCRTGSGEKFQKRFKFRMHIEQQTLRQLSCIEHLHTIIHDYLWLIVICRLEYGSNVQQRLLANYEYMHVKYL